LEDVEELEFVKNAVLELGKEFVDAHKEEDITNVEETEECVDISVKLIKGLPILQEFVVIFGLESIVLGEILVLNIEDIDTEDVSIIDI